MSIIRTEQEEAAVRELFERLQMLETEVGRLKRATSAIQQGVPFTEALNDELYLEAKQEQKQAHAALAIMVEHLLKIAYCTNSRNISHWCNEVNTQRKEANKLAKWGWKKPDTNLIKYLDENIQDIYEDGITEYRKAAKKYPDLRDGLKLIPEECPWSLEELMEDEIDALISTLHGSGKKRGK